MILERPAKKLLTTQEAAEILSVRPQTLAIWRATKRYDLPYIRVGNAIRYRLADLEMWLESRAVGGVTNG